MTPLSGLAAADAVRAAVGDHVAEHLAESDAVWRFDGSPVVAGVWEHPVLGTTEVHVPLVPAEALGDSARLRRFLAAVAATWPDAADISLRLAPRSPEPLPDARLGATYVRKRVDPAAERAQPPDGVEIRPPEPGDIPKVHGLLGDAMMVAFGASGRQTDRGAVDAYVAERFARLDPDVETQALVATVDGEFAGHVTWITDAVDDLEDEAYVELVDVWVLTPFRRLGLTQAFVGALERRTAPGTALLGHVVAGDDQPYEQVLAGLLASGWTLFYDVWYWSSASASAS